MNNYNFFILVFNNIYIGVLCTIISFIIYFFAMKSYFTSILDPLFFAAVLSGFGFSVVMFLFVTKSIEIYFFLSYLLTQLLLYLGFVSGHKLWLSKSSLFVYKLGNYKDFLFIFFTVSLFIFIVLQLIVYKTAGIPLFMKSRLEAFAGGSGSGLISRFISVSEYCSLFMMLIFIFDKNYSKKTIIKLLILLSFCFFIISAILSGSKGSFLILGYIFFCYSIMAGKRGTISSVFMRNEKKIICVAIFVAILVAGIQTNNWRGGFSTFIYRFVYAGDVYWSAYPNKSIDKLSGEHPWQALFTDFLGLTRIVPWKELPEAIGINLFKMHQFTDTIQGPNARHNVFGYVYFGFLGSIFFSFVIGFMIGQIRKIFMILKTKNILSIIFISYLYINIFGLEVDPMYALSLFNSFLIVFPCLVFLSSLLYYSIKVR